MKEENFSKINLQIKIRKNFRKKNFQLSLILIFYINGNLFRIFLEEIFFKK